MKSHLAKIASSLYQKALTNFGNWKSNAVTSQLAYHNNINQFYKDKYLVDDDN